MFVFTHAQSCFESSIRLVRLYSSTTIRASEHRSLIRRYEAKPRPDSLPGNKPMRLCIMLDLASHERMAAFKKRFCEGKIKSEKKTDFVLLSNLPGEQAPAVTAIIKRVIKGYPPLRLPKAIPIVQRSGPIGLSLTADFTAEILRMCTEICAGVKALPHGDAVRVSRALYHPVTECSIAEAKKLALDISNAFPSGVDLGIPKYLKLYEGFLANYTRDNLRWWYPLNSRFEIQK